MGLQSGAFFAVAWKAELVDIKRSIAITRGLINGLI